MKLIKTLLMTSVLAVLLLSIGCQSEKSCSGHTEGTAGQTPAGVQTEKPCD
jgi:hypothetical protein